MTEPELQTQTDAAEAYEQLFVPAMMREWAARVVDAAGVRAGTRVLDLACGTGIVGRTVGERMLAGVAVTGVDRNPGMLAVARRLGPTIDWRQGTAEQLQFPDASFDVVTCQFGLMFFGNRGAALREILRVLVPGGRLVLAVWDSVENIPAYAAEVALLERRGGSRAADALRAPFVLGDRQRLAAMVREAGAADVAIATDSATARFPSVRVMVEADLRGWLPVMGVDLSEPQIAAILADADEVLSAFVGADGSIAFDQSAHIVTAVKR